MKKFFLFLSLLILIIIASTVLKISLAIYNPSPGTLRVLTKPQGSIITIDNKQIGSSPFKTQVPPADHTLKLINNVGERKLVWEKTITVSPDGQTEVNVEFGPSAEFDSGEILNSDTGQGLIVTTEPDDAQIFLDEEDKGTSPLYIPDLNPGKHRLRLVKTGYISRDVVINIIQDSRLATTIFLSKDPLANQPQLLESFRNASLYAVQTDDPALLNNTKNWSEAIFYTQKISPTEKNKTFTDLIDFNGNHFVSKEATGNTKVIGYLSQKNQSLTDSAKKIYEQLANKSGAIYSASGKIEVNSSPTGSVNLRDKPDNNGAIIGKVNNGQQADITQETNEWYHIKIGNREGWISREFTKKL